MFHFYELSAKFSGTAGVRGRANASKRSQNHRSGRRYIVESSPEHMVERLERRRVRGQADETRSGVIADVLETRDVLPQPALVRAPQAIADERAHPLLRLAVLQDHVTLELQVLLLRVQRLDDEHLALAVAVEDLLHLVQVVQEIADEDYQALARDALAVLVHALEEVALPGDLDVPEVIEQVREVPGSPPRRERRDVLSERVHVELLVVP